MNTEENRVKMSKYRARRSLRELGYTEDEIATLITFTNWSSTTPAQFLASLSPDSPPARVDRARQPRETPEATQSASVPRETRRARAEPPEATEPEREEEYTGGVWSILGGVVILGVAILGIVAQAINKSRPK